MNHTFKKNIIFDMVSFKVWVTLHQQQPKLISPNKFSCRLLLRNCIKILSVIWEMKLWHMNIQTTLHPFYTRPAKSTCVMRRSKPSLGLLVNCILGVSYMTPGVVPPSGNSAPCGTYSWITAFILLLLLLLLLLYLICNHLPSCAEN